jgi:hypothetical protein
MYPLMLVSQTAVWRLRRLRHCKDRADRRRTKAGYLHWLSGRKTTARKTRHRRASGPPKKEEQVSEIRSDDRTWVEAVDRYVAGVRRERPTRPANGRYVLLSALVLAVTMSPVAIGATGSVLREGKRNPSSGAAARETEMISRVKTYGTRQSNIRNGNGGGAIYGCRASAGREACVRANNLKNGRAFEFESDGDEVGFIEAKTPAARPFATNATGVAAGLNADRIDSLNAAKVDFRAKAPTASTQVLNLGGLILSASCATGPGLDVRASSSVPDSLVHVSWNRDPGNVPFYRQDNDLDPGDAFSIMGDNDDASAGTLTYTTPAGANVSLTFLSDQGPVLLGSTASCVFSGTALQG